MFATTCRRPTAISPKTTQRRQRQIPEPVRSANGVLVVPGYLMGAEEFVPLVEQLRQRGFDAALPAIRWYNWLPTLGGRSLRPILDRIDYAARSLSNGARVCSENGYEIPPPSKETLFDLLKELQNARNGAQTRQESSEVVTDNRVAIVASSAAGWICRIFLGSGPPYGDRVYHGSDVVHSLVTLGSPHICNEGITRQNVAFVNAHFPGAFENDVRYLCIAGRAVQGQTFLGGSLKDFTYQSYELCSSNGRDWGDGVTPVDCAIGLEGAEKVILDDVWHSPRSGRRWYGSEDVLDQWVSFLQK